MQNQETIVKYINIHQFVKQHYLVYNLNMKRFLFTLSILTMLALPAFSAESPDDIKQELKEQVILYYNTNSITQCVETLAKIPDVEKNAQDWLIMANIAQDRQKPLDAVFFLQRAIIADPKFYKAYYNLGNVYFENDNINLAMNNYRKAIKLKENFAYAYYNMGCCYLKKGNYRLARYYFANAIKYNDQEPSFYYNIAYTYKMLKNTKRANEAMDFYQDLMGK